MSNPLIGETLGELVLLRDRVKRLEAALSVDTKLLRRASQRLYNQGYDESSEELERLLRNIDQLRIERASNP